MPLFEIQGHSSEDSVKGSSSVDDSDISTGVADAGLEPGVGEHSWEVRNRMDGVTTTHACTPDPVTVG